MSPGPVESEPVGRAVELAARLLESGRLVEPGRRQMLGITGGPGAGKSTLASEVVEALDGAAVLVPMDGFHLSNSALGQLGRAGRKGAPDTFDAAGYVALLRRLRSADSETVWAPAFDRDLEEAIAGSIPVPPSTQLVVTEGSYLLLADGPWSGVRPLLDACWFVTVDEPVRTGQLVERHVRHGRSLVAAQAWVRDVDAANAALVAATSERADLLLRR